MANGQFKRRFKKKKKKKKYNKAQYRIIPLHELGNHAKGHIF